jgi:hypothetical protein
VICFAPFQGLGGDEIDFPQDRRLAPHSPLDLTGHIFVPVTQADERKAFRAALFERGLAAGAE